jgi:hypothetical protein
LNSDGNQPGKGLVPTEVPTFNLAGGALQRASANV